jgi:hypothetical protein
MRTMVRTGMSPFLVRLLSRGEYVVDARAVAEAMLARMPCERSLGRGVSRVLVALKRTERLVAPPEEDGPRVA